MASLAIGEDGKTARVVVEADQERVVVLRFCLWQKVGKLLPIEEAREVLELIEGKKAPSQ